MTTNDMVSLRPFVILAIKMMGPGRLRLEMVKLAHDLHDARGDVASFNRTLQVAGRTRTPQPQPFHQRAA